MLRRAYVEVECANPPWVNLRGDCKYQSAVAWTCSGGKNDHQLVHRRGRALWRLSSGVLPDWQWLCWSAGRWFSARWPTPLAIQFGLGHWNARVHKSTDDGDFTADVWPGSAKTGDPSGGV